MLNFGGCSSTSAGHMLSATQVDVHFITDHRSGRDAAEWRGGSHVARCQLREKVWFGGSRERLTRQILKLHVAHIIIYYILFDIWVFFIDSR